MLLLLACTRSAPTDSGATDDSVSDDDTSVEDTSCEKSTWYVDADRDGFGGGSTEACDQPPDHIDVGGDCDDEDASVYPGAPELCDGQQNDCSSDWTQDDLVTFTHTDGTVTDVSADFRGSPGVPAEPWFDQSGTFEFCAATYHFDLKTNGEAVTLRGAGSGATLFDGGGAHRFLYIQKSDAVVRVEGITMTNGWGCYGTAISVWQANSCSESGASSGGGYSNVDLTLQDVVIEGNENLRGNALVSLKAGKLSLIDSVIRDNEGDVIWAEESDFSCQNSAITGNTETGVEIRVEQFETSHEVSVTDCDFGAAGTAEDNEGTDFVIDQWPSGTDVRVDLEDGVSFTCDTTVAACE